jgi:hypothetical protein
MDSRLPGQTAIPGDHWASKWSYGSWGHRDTVRFDTAIYVLHCFKKNSKRGITPPRTISS